MQNRCTYEHQIRKVQFRNTDILRVTGCISVCIGGASAKIGVGIASKTFSKSIEIWGKNNSPVRVYYHIEDGVLRTSCTRGKEFAAQGGWTSYWTSPGSRYFNPAGVGSYFDAGAGAGGAIVRFIPIHSMMQTGLRSQDIVEMRRHFIFRMRLTGMRLLQSEIGHFRTGRI